MCRGPAGKVSILTLPQAASIYFIGHALILPLTETLSQCSNLFLSVCPFRHSLCKCRDVCMCVQRSNNKPQLDSKVLTRLPPVRYTWLHSFQASSHLATAVVGQANLTGGFFPDGELPFSSLSAKICKPFPSLVLRRSHCLRSRATVAALAEAWSLCRSHRISLRQS